jgi:transcriptional regulator with XRE-family HTH domain
MPVPRSPPKPSRTARGPAAIPHRMTLGRRLRELRRANGWTLAEVAQRTGLATSTISKVERGHMSLTYDRFMQLAERLELDVTALFSREGQAFGADTIAVTRRGKAKRYDTPTYVYEMLASDLAGKHMVPMTGRVTARSFEEFADYVRHPGEEFLIVLDGLLMVHIEGRRPVRLAAGDSLYFNSGLGHAYVSVGSEDARILVVCWQPRPDMPLPGLAMESSAKGKPEL